MPSRKTGRAFLRRLRCFCRAGACPLPTCTMVVLVREHPSLPLEGAPQGGLSCPFGAIHLLAIRSLPLPPGAGDAVHRRGCGLPRPFGARNDRCSRCLAGTNRIGQLSNLVEPPQSLRDSSPIPCGTGEPKKCPPGFPGGHWLFGQERNYSPIICLNRSM